MAVLVAMLGRRYHEVLFPHIPMTPHHPKRKLRFGEVRHHENILKAEPKFD